MAIIIPSKNIYQRDNKKMIDNAIANVSFNENIYNRNVIEMYSEENASTLSTESHTQTYVGDWGTGGEAKRVRFELDCVYHLYTFTATASEAIRDDEIRLLTYITTQGNTQAGNFDNYEYLAKQQYIDYTIDNIPLPIPASTDYSEIAEFCNEKIKEKLVFSIESINNYRIDTALSYLKSINVYLVEETIANGVWGSTTRNQIGVYPNVTGLQLSLFLNYSQVVKTAKTIGKTGLTNALSENELLQDKTLISGQKASEFISNAILTSYKNGKETATLLCDISNYYDENGNKVISIDSENMSFRLYDEVIPMLFNYDGRDVPMSRKKDGSTKTFIVVGSNIFYDGAVWQKLSLQEA